MPERIWFDGLIPMAQRPAIAAALAPLADAGYKVRVEIPDEALAPHGWRIRLDVPGRHASFRIPVGTTPAEWTATVAALLRKPG